LEKALPFSVSHGTLSKTIIKLNENKLIRKRKDGRYEITFEGRWALRKGATEPPTLDPHVKRLMELHGYDELTPAQREFFNRSDLLRLRRNVCIFAFPDQGKTLMAELYMLKVLMSRRKVVYLTPYKALNREKHELFYEIYDLGLGFSVRRVDGDTPTRLRDLERARLVVATYERASIDFTLRRKWMLDRELLIADEITLLEDEDRGPDIDLFLTTVRAKYGMKIVTLSSHIGNEDDLVKWLDGTKFPSLQTGPRREFLASLSDNSVVLEEVRGPYKKILSLDNSPWTHVIMKRIEAEGEGKTLFLSGARMRVEHIAAELLLLPRKSIAKGYMPDLPFLEETALAQQLVSYMSRGISFHHAGVPHFLRRVIENGVRECGLNAISATTTLSHGVNLPFSAVVLDFDSFTDLKRVDYEQYVGRARASAVGRSVSVYIVTSNPIDARRVFAGGLEDIQPKTLKPILVEKIILSTMAGRRPIVESTLVTNVNRSLSRTAGFICSKSKPEVEPAIRSTLRKMLRTHFLSKKRNIIQLTDRGQLLTELGLDCEEDNWIRKELQTAKYWEPSDLELLRIACTIGLAKDFEYLKNPKERAKLLSDWIEETSLDRIVSLFRSHMPLRDADVPRLAHDVAEELTKVSRIAEHMRLIEIKLQAMKLVRRLRHGVEDDLAETDLLDLKNMNRLVARKLFDGGFKSTFEIYESEPGTIVKECHLGEREARLIHKEVWSKRNDDKWMREYKKWRRKR